MIRLTRPRMLGLDELGRIRETALRVLERHGLRVLDAKVLEAAAQAKLTASDGRLRFSRRIVEEVLPEPVMRPEMPTSSDPARVQLELTVCQYATHLHDPETDAITPLTETDVVEAAKLVDVLADEGVVGGAPGSPQNVSPYLQPVLQYKIQAELCRHGRVPIDPKWVPTVPYVMEMAEVLGHPIRRLPVYMISPLTLGGESLKAVMTFRDRLEGVHVSNMSSVGVTAPIRIAEALALGLAEAVGGSLVVEALTELPVSWSVATIPFDLRAGAMSYGGPEHVLFRWACHEVKAAFQDLKPESGYGVVRSQAKLPGPQAASDKMAGLVSGALVGDRSFDGAGALSLEEVFSAEQAIIDCELRDYVQRLVEGIDGACHAEIASEEIGDGCYDGYLSLDSTLSGYRDTYWLPRLSERRTLPGWLGARGPDLRARAQALAREKVKQHCYELPSDLRAELERIYRTAKRELAV